MRLLYHRALFTIQDRLSCSNYAGKRVLHCDGTVYLGSKLSWMVKISITILHCIQMPIG